MPRWSRGTEIRQRLAPYAVAILVSCLVVLVIVVTVRVFLAPGDEVTIEVVPIGAQDRLRVQVAGAVVRPGVYALPQGGTVGGAIELAGGVTESAELDQREVEKQLTDGEFILVPGRDLETAETAGPIDINEATLDELETLPGIGPVIGERIIQYREMHGGFGSIDELANVSGISERMVDEMSHLIVVSTD